MKETFTWQPTIIADTAHVQQFHTCDPGAVTCHAGRAIRVRRGDGIPRDFIEDQRRLLGCFACIFVLVHPEDAGELWPDIENANVVLCEHDILTD